MNYVTMFLFSIENSSNVVIKRTCIFRLYSKIRDIPKLYLKFSMLKVKKKSATSYPHETQKSVSMYTKYNGVNLICLHD